MDKETRRIVMKNLYGVSEITSNFQNKINELFYQQTKALTLKTVAIKQ